MNCGEPHLTAKGGLRFAIGFARTPACVDRPAYKDILAWNSCLGNSPTESLLVPGKNTGKKVADTRLTLHGAHVSCARLANVDMLNQANTRPKHMDEPARLALCKTRRCHLHKFVDQRTRMGIASLPIVFIVG